MRVLFSQLLILAMLIGCANSSEESKSKWITVADVLSKPSEFDGKVVTLKGWVSMRPEDYGVWESEDDYKKRNWKKCLSLLNFYFDDSLNKKLDRNSVLIAGTFTKDIFHDGAGRAIIRMGTCSQFGMRFIEPAGLILAPGDFK